MIDKILEWSGFWVNAAACMVNLSFYAAFHRWYSLPAAGLSMFVAIAFMPKHGGQQ